MRRERGLRLAEDDLPARVARLARLGRTRRFSVPRFEAALSASARGVSREELLRRLLREWTGVRLAQGRAAKLWERVVRAHERMRAALGPRVSLQAALLQELHSARGLLREPRIVPERDFAALRVNAITDPLTGLYNRRFFLAHLERELSRAERLGATLSVLLMDLQSFKRVNDQLGHPVGDGVLVRTAELIRESLRVADAGCRYGGDEFVAVLPHTSLVHGLGVAERIRRRVARMRLAVQHRLRLGLHYGIASYPTDGRSLELLIRSGDRRLYDCRRQDSNPWRRRHPRFAVEGVSLRLKRASRGRPRALDVKDIGYGGLAFVYPSDRPPRRLEGEIVQQFSAQAHRVAMRPVSVQPLAGGRSRVGCAYES